MNVIAAVSENWGIGKNNDLLFHIPDDMKLFRRLTKDRTVILGRKTLESFPGGQPLKGRRHLVLSADPSYTREDVGIFRSVPDILEAVKDLPSQDVWVIGGGMIYELFLPYCEKAYITKVHENRPADVFFPDLDADPAWTLQDCGEDLDCGGLSYCFSTYLNNAVKKG